jgi:hypothetical protein
VTRRIAMTAKYARDFWQPLFLTHIPDYAQPTAATSIDFQETIAPPQKRVSYVRAK